MSTVRVQKGYDVPENQKLQRLREIIRDLESVVVAFSGGVDSSLLAKVSSDVLGDRALAVTASSETYPGFEREEAEEFCKRYNIRHQVVHTEELTIEGFKNNPPNRCYYCKQELFQRLRRLADDLGFKHVADGSNTDDVSDFRPGMRAAEELGVQSPLKEAGLGKQDVRNLSKELGLPTWDKPAYACLSSRFPYGKTITPEALSMVGQAEDFLRHHGFRQFRVRHHDTLARIELAPEDFGKMMAPGVRGKVVARFKEIGYTYIALDLQGYRTGSMNETLDTTERK